jgi:hypothetical protein
MPQRVAMKGARCQSIWTQNGKKHGGPIPDRFKTRRLGPMDVIGQMACHKT